MPDLQISGHLRLHKVSSAVVNSYTFYRKGRDARAPEAGKHLGLEVTRQFGRQPRSLLDGRSRNRQPRPDLEPVRRP